MPESPQQTYEPVSTTTELPMNSNYEPISTESSYNAAYEPTSTETPYYNPYKPTSTETPYNNPYEPTPNQVQANMDSMMAAIDQKDFSQLLDIAQSKFYADACAQSFKRRYGDHEIIIENDSKFNVGDYWDEQYSSMKQSIIKFSPFKSSQSSVYISDTFIKFSDLTTVLKTLRHFGHMIKKLTLNLSNVDTTHSKEIIRHVDEYCTESLVELRLGVNGIHALKQFSRSFEKVEHVTFEGHSSKNSFFAQKGNSIPANLLFPALRTMTLKISFNNDYLAHHFPNLETVQIDVTSDSIFNFGFGKKDYLSGFLMVNPQIQNVELNGYDQEALDQISMMPYLRHMTFKWNTPITKEFRSESLTKFTMIDNINASPKNLMFPNLEEIEMYFYDSKFEDWMAFMNEHQYLKRLHFNFDVLKDDRFIILTSILQNLEEIHIDSLDGREIAVDEIIQFINTHGKLRKIQLNTCSETDKKILQSAFSREWHITDYSEGISLERF